MLRKLFLTLCLVSWAGIAQAQTPTKTPLSGPYCCLFASTCAEPDAQLQCPDGSTPVANTGCNGVSCVTVTPTPTNTVAGATPTQTPTPINGNPVAGNCKNFLPNSVGRFGP